MMKYRFELEAIGMVVTLVASDGLEAAILFGTRLRELSQSRGEPLSVSGWRMTIEGYDLETEDMGTEPGVLVLYTRP